MDGAAKKKTTRRASEEATKGRQERTSCHFPVECHYADAGFLQGLKKTHFFTQDAKLNV
ncbi:hypothetical protein DPMN_146793 [Dreissena polymorpha]|uniref:Uncharacterized protein n=1 Tax=Dreissena polymorpha TaxID=45954 RepID=A0A9D4FB01_DREPO|nr:hypothetical protein DPMN_146793 [Dreissena polymorpha]